MFLGQRRLSDVEWSTFLHEVPLANLNLPPWGALVDWQGMKILVYVAPFGEVFLTDVSDYIQVDQLATVPKMYDPDSASWTYYVPQEWMRQTVAVVEQVPNAIVKVAETIGEAAGKATQPVLQSLTLPLIVIGSVAAFTLLKH